MLFQECQPKRARADHVENLKKNSTKRSGVAV